MRSADSNPGSIYWPIAALTVAAILSDPYDAKGANTDRQDGIIVVDNSSNNDSSPHGPGVPVPRPKTTPNPGLTLAPGLDVIDTNYHSLTDRSQFDAVVGLGLDIRELIAKCKATGGEAPVVKKAKADEGYGYISESEIKCDNKGGRIVTELDDEIHGNASISSLRVTAEIGGKTAEFTATSLTALCDKNNGKLPYTCLRETASIEEKSQDHKQWLFSEGHTVKSLLGDFSLVPGGEVHPDSWFRPEDHETFKAILEEAGISVETDK